MNNEFYNSNGDINEVKYLVEGETVNGKMKVITFRLKELLDKKLLQLTNKGE